MCSLRASNQAMKKAGLADGVAEAEKVMGELDDQIREASELTSVLAEPLTDHTLGMGAGPGIDDELNRELDEELGLLESETVATIAPPRSRTRPRPAATTASNRAHTAPIRTPHDGLVKQIKSARDP